MLFNSKKKAADLKEISKIDSSALEAKKVKSAILIDFILSIEIIIITLGTVLDEPISIQISVVSIIALLSTIGVYSFVALLVRMDDVGYRLVSVSEKIIIKNFGMFLIRSLPKIIRLLKVVGTLAMILVGGGIFVHNIDAIHQLVYSWPKYLSDFTVGLAFGTVFLGIFLFFKKLSFK
jgi:predicted DNA repair protein MutK